MKAEQYNFISNALIAMAGDISYNEWQTNRILILLGVLTGVMLILGIVIIINQIRIRKQLRQIREQLKQKDNKDVS